jgi:hypothetical protein
MSVNSRESDSGAVKLILIRYQAGVDRCLAVMNVGFCRQGMGVMEELILSNAAPRLFTMFTSHYSLSINYISFSSNL